MAPQSATLTAAKTGRPIDLARMQSGNQCGKCGSHRIGSEMRHIGGRGYQPYLVCLDCGSSARSK